MIDVGGGQATCWPPILERHRGTRGVLTDLPHVIDEARTRIASLGVLARCDFQGIDFFESVPSGGDVYVLPAGDTPHPGTLLDLAMLVMSGGQERPAEEYRLLLNAAGFRMTRVIPTASAVSLVEAVAAS